MYGGRRVAYLVVVLLASRAGWFVYDLVLRWYGDGATNPLSASPSAAAAAGIGWLVTTMVLLLPGIVLVHYLGR